MARRNRIEEKGETPQQSQDEGDGRRRLESMVPELIKRAVIGSYDRASEAQESIKNFISESKLPKEITSTVLNQIDETKRGLFRVVGKEVRRFLEAIDLQHELQKFLTAASIEIKTEIRFVPNQNSAEKENVPEVKSEVEFKMNSTQPASTTTKENAQVKDESAK